MVADGVGCWGAVFTTRGPRWLTVNTVADGETEGRASVVWNLISSQGVQNSASLGSKMQIFCFHCTFYLAPFCSSISTIFNNWPSARSWDGQGGGEPEVITLRKNVHMQMCILLPFPGLQEAAFSKRIFYQEHTRSKRTEG